MAKTNNALVTYTDLTTMGLVAKGTPATGNRIATVAFINSNYYVNQSASPYNTYTSLRCPPYQTILPGPTNSGTLYYTIDYGGGNFAGFNTSEEACAHTTGGSVTVYWSGAFGNGTVIYTDPNGSQFDGNGFFSLNGYSFATDVNAVYDYAVCSSGVVFTTLSGLYPVSSGNATAIGTLTNYTGSTVYIKGLFNSGSLNSGYLIDNNIYFNTPGIFTEYLSYDFFTVISSSNQNIYTDRNSDSIRPGYFDLLSGVTANITIDKFDENGDGSTLRLAYATTPSGSYTPI
jgi:hypothetical protein